MKKNLLLLKDLLMTSFSKNVYISKLDDIIDKCNNTYRIIKTKPIDVQPSTYFDFEVESNDKDPKFGVGDHVRISKSKNISAKGYTPNWSEEALLLKQLKILYHGHMY